MDVAAARCLGDEVLLGTVVLDLDQGGRPVQVEDPEPALVADPTGVAAE